MRSRETGEEKKGGMDGYGWGCLVNVWVSYHTFERDNGEASW